MRTLVEKSSTPYPTSWATSLEWSSRPTWFDRPSRKKNKIHPEPERNTFRAVWSLSLLCSADVFVQFLLHWLRFLRSTTSIFCRSATFSGLWGHYVPRRTMLGNSLVPDPLRGRQVSQLFHWLWHRQNIAFSPSGACQHHTADSSNNRNADRVAGHAVEIYVLRLPRCKIKRVTDAPRTPPHLWSFVHQIATASGFLFQITPP